MNYAALWFLVLVVGASVAAVLVWSVSYSQGGDGPLGHPCTESGSLAESFDGQAVDIRVGPRRTFPMQDECRAYTRDGTYVGSRLYPSTGALFLAFAIFSIPWLAGGLYVIGRRWHTARTGVSVRR